MVGCVSLVRISIKGNSWNEGTQAIVIVIENTSHPVWEGHGHKFARGEGGRDVLLQATIEFKRPYLNIQLFDWLFLSSFYTERDSSSDPGESTQLIVKLSMQISLFGRYLVSISIQT